MQSKERYFELEKVLQSIRNTVNTISQKSKLSPRLLAVVLLLGAGALALILSESGTAESVPVQAETVPAQLKNGDVGTLAVVNGNYALQAGLKVADALAIENAEGDAAQTYANIIAVRKA